MPAPSQVSAAGGAGGVAGAGGGGLCGSGVDVSAGRRTAPPSRNARAAGARCSSGPTEPVAGVPPGRPGQLHRRA